MLFNLLLQVTKTIAITDAVLPAVYGTLVAAVLSLAASIYATITSSKTAEKVAGLAKQAAQELKDKEYTHDFYKRIIAKRFTAWEEAEQFIVEISETVIDETDNERFYRFCASGERLKAMLDKMRLMMLNQTQWMGKEYGMPFMDIHNFCVEILREAMRLEEDSNRIAAIDDRKLALLGKANYEQLNKIINQLIATHGKLIVIIHDVPSFLEEYRNSTISTKF
ncbi:hypothetical protein SAMN00120144_4209 [Hymenobacter roseosalivarius DSM 11622]|uniref:Uncharacterized protein n=1 Tax=Hymenobacter roseosalivarius DSM 11622 TaxID=645990 RepID=A0A1W1UIG3_9BACT|nr:hypothetical protein [Hymenobacter roseosalivarius]SMB80857.1 hypothetical protein SAMN00120144_4209 [Hymenobacter roseosalivarius DSM 11622]